MAQQTCHVLTSWNDDISSLAAVTPGRLTNAASLVARRTIVVDYMRAIYDRTAQLSPSFKALGARYHDVPGASGVEEALAKEFDHTTKALAGAVPIAQTMPTDSESSFDAVKAKIQDIISNAGGNGMQLSDLHISSVGDTAAVFKALQTDPACAPIFG